MLSPYPSPFLLNPIEIREWARAAAAVGLLSVPAALFTLWRRWHRRVVAKRRLRDAELAALVVMLDFIRSRVQGLLEGPLSLHDRENLGGYRFRVRQARNELWAAMGLPQSVNATEREVGLALQKLRITRRLNPATVERIRREIEAKLTGENSAGTL